MSEDLQELPLFPLHTVLFPYAQIQLNVFEERYRGLVRECYQEGRPLGIVLSRSTSQTGGFAEPYMVGTMVRIISVVTHEDDSLEILVIGESRFRIRHLDESREYLVGLVEPVNEMEIEQTPRMDALMIKVRESFRMLIEGVLSRQEYKVQVQFPEDPVALSFTIASFLQLEDLQKQRLLEITDTSERFIALLPMLEGQAEALEQTVYYRLDREELKEWINPN